MREERRSAGGAGVVWVGGDGTSARSSGWAEAVGAGGCGSSASGAGCGSSASGAGGAGVTWANGGGSGIWVIRLEMLVSGSEIGETGEVAIGDVVAADEVGASVVCE